MPGRHNVQNALAAITVGLEMGMTDKEVARGFASFGGVKRRFTKAGEVDGITVIDDYAHHPVEIRAVLSAARESAAGRVIAVCQPHRFTRLESLFEEFATCFNDAEIVYVAPVYAAGEQPIEGVNAAELVGKIKRRGHHNAGEVADAADLARIIAETGKPGDMVVCLGAGDITKWAAGLADAVKGVRG